jgi:CubicO group peptidase (beta-lactamase class C family)
MKRLFFVPILFLMCFAGASADTIIGPAGNSLDRYMRFAEAAGFSGTVLVARDGKVVLSHGYGEAIRETGSRNTSESAFDIGSVTKQFTAAAIARLEVDGKLSTSNTLATYFSDVPPDKANITIHQLLSHTSGIAVYGPGADFSVVPEETERKYLFAQPLAFAPGTSSRYSNGDYTLLAYIIERVAGMRFEQYLHDTFFAPLGMKYTGDALPVWSDAQSTYAYSDRLPFSLAPFTKSMPYYGNVYGNGSVISTADDMYLWIAALAAGLVVPQVELAKMLTPDPLSGYGYAWEIVQRNGRTVAGHGGLSDFGYNTRVEWTPDGRAVVIILSNVDSMLGSARPRDAVNGPLMDVAMGVRSLDVPDIRPVRQEPLVHSLSGMFRLRSGGSLVARAVGNLLVLDPLDQSAVDALGGFDAATRSRLDGETRTSEQLLAELVAGKCAVATGVSPQHTEGLCRGLMGRLGALTSANGGVAPPVHVIGSVPSWWEPDGTDATFVSVGGKVPLIFRLHWRGRTIESLGGKAIANPLETPLTPVSAMTLIGFNPGAVNLVRATVRTGGLALRNAAGEYSEMARVR